MSDGSRMDVGVVRGVAGRGAGGGRWRRGMASEQGVALVVALVAVLGAAVAFDAVVASMGLRLRKEPIYPAGDLKFHTLNTSADGTRVSLPTFRVASDVTVSPEELEELGTENYLSRWYESESPPFEREGPVFIQLHCAYYTGMIDTVPHVPERCMVGAGMQMVESPRLVDVPLTLGEPGSLGGFLPATDVDREAHGLIYTGRCSESFERVRLPRGVEDLKLNTSAYVNENGQRIYAGYFFISNGRLYPTAIGVRQSGISLNDEYAFYAKVQVMSSDVESAEELGLLAGGLLDEVFASIARRVPDWIEVTEGRYPAVADGDSGAG